MRAVLLHAGLSLVLACGGPVPEEEIGPPRMDVAIAPESGASASTSTSSGLEWQLPEGWIEETPSSGMRLMQARTEDGVEMVVFFFGEGQGGDVESNFARWRGQIETTEEVAESSFDGDGLSIHVMDASGTLTPNPMAGITSPRPDSRMLAAVIEGKGGPWFFRATGPASAVGARRDEIVSFLKSLSHG